MSWARWKRGLVISLLTTLLTEAVVILADPQIAWRAMVALLVGTLVKDALLYLKSHPVDELPENNQTNK